MGHPARAGPCIRFDFRCPLRAVTRARRTRVAGYRVTGAGDPGSEWSQPGYLTARIGPPQAGRSARFSESGGGAGRGCAVTECPTRHGQPLPPNHYHCARRGESCIRPGGDADHRNRPYGGILMKYPGQGLERNENRCVQSISGGRQSSAAVLQVPGEHAWRLSKRVVC
jgi:hypothetical protein